MIRQFQISDTEQVMQIWLQGNEDAHPFIPGKYWRSHFAAVQEQIKQAEVSVYEAEGKIQGFIGITEGYIAGIFVSRSYRSCGIGRQLLEYAKQMHSTLSLDVYEKNTQAVDFYLREKFVIASRQTDENTGETEFTMSFSKKTEEQK